MCSKTKLNILHSANLSEWERLWLWLFEPKPPERPQIKKAGLSLQEVDQPNPNPHDRGRINES